MPVHFFYSLKSFQHCIFVLTFVGSVLSSFFKYRLEDHGLHPVGNTPPGTCILSPGGSHTYHLAVCTDKYLAMKKLNMLIEIEIQQKYSYFTLSQKAATRFQLTLRKLGSPFVFESRLDNGENVPGILVLYSVTHFKSSSSDPDGGHSCITRYTVRVFLFLVFLNDGKLYYLSRERKSLRGS